ncbi:MAG: IS200/IS605 family transposase [Victivallales bacterium]|jgi:putative transposase|nr:IS200/IS605 family transposase [Victivallales bacterium]
MGHTFTRLLYHVVFSTKQRRRAIQPHLRSELLAYMHGVVRNEQARILESAATADHVHLLISAGPTHVLADLVRTLKASSSRWGHGKWPDARAFAWQNRYGAFSVSESSVPRMVAYLKGQEEHHRRVPFGEELRALLEKHRIPYDATHFLD